MDGGVLSAPWWEEKTTTKEKKTTQQHGMTENERDKLGKIVSTEAFGTADRKSVV